MREIENIRIAAAGVAIYLVGPVGTASQAFAACLALLAIALASSARPAADVMTLSVAIGSCIAAVLMSAKSGGVQTSSLAAAWFGVSFLLGAAQLHDRSRTLARSFISSVQAHASIGLLLSVIGISGNASTAVAIRNGLPLFQFRESLVLTSSPAHSASIGVICAAAARGHPVHRAIFVIIGVLTAMQSGYRVASLIALVAGLTRIIGVIPKSRVFTGSLVFAVLPFWWPLVSSVVTTSIAPVLSYIPGLQRTTTSSTDLAEQLASLQGRRDIWSAATQSLSERSVSELFLGSDRPPFEADRFRSLDAFSDQDSISAHNSVLEHLSTAGLLGLLIVAAAVISSQSSARRRTPSFLTLPLAALVLMATTESLLSWASFGTSGLFAFMLGSERGWGIHSIASTNGEIPPISQYDGEPLRVLPAKSSGLRYKTG